MLKNKKLWKSVVCMLLAVCILASLAACGCSNNPTEPKPSTGPSATASAKATYTVTVKNSGGLALEGIAVYIYADATLSDLITFVKTDAEGKVTFSETASEKYVAVLQNLPTGYAAEAYYTLTGQLTEIVLSAAQKPTEGQEVKYKLGDMVMDFDVTAPDGTKYTLSELLKKKRAVVLNFWYTKCDPCKMEFPYLQEAYAEYSDMVEVLALNPVDQDDATIAAFKKDNGLTFPMAKVDPQWEQTMQITGYPTTVVIDRFGNITLIHKGTITDAKTFKDMFAYFTADDYNQKLIQNITEIESIEEVGTQENPLEIGGVSKYELTLKPGQVYYINGYRMNEMYMQIRDKDAYVIYNNKTYKPEGNTVGLVLYCPDTYTPAQFAVGNNSAEEKTFTITFGPLAGSFNNPYDLELGEFTARVTAGKEKGICYSFDAPEDGVLTMQCLSVSGNVAYDYTLYNLDSYAHRTMSGEGQTDPATGAVILSMPMKKGQTVLFSIGTLPDENYNYPAGIFEMKATFTAGSLEETDKVEKIPYTVTVTDEKGTPVADVSVYLTGNEQSVAIKTDAAGVATVELPKGEYTGRLTIPTDYTLEVNEFKLTESEPSVTVQMVKKVVTILDYVVKVVDMKGDPVPGVMLIVGDGFAATGENGTATFNLIKNAYTVEVFDVPEEYILPTQMFAFQNEATTLTITLEKQQAQEVYVGSSMSFTTDSIAPGKKLFYDVYRVGGTVLTINDKDAYVVYDGKIYGANANCVVEVPLKAETTVYPISLQIGNAGTSAAKAFKVQFRYPQGHVMNPQVLNSLGSFTVNIEKDNNQGYVLQWTAAKKGTVSFKITSVQAAAGVECDIKLSNNRSYAHRQLSESSNGVVSMDVLAGDVVTIEVGTCPDKDFNYPAAKITVYGSFQEYVAPPKPTEPPTEPTVPPTEPTVPPTEPTVPPTEPTVPPTEPTVPPTEPEVIEPVDVRLGEDMSFTTDRIAAGKELHYNVYGVSGMVLTINDKYAYVVYNGKTYGANSNGVVELNMEPGVPFYPNFIQIGNASATTDKAFKVQFSYPVGTMMNPQILNALGMFRVELAEGNDQGYYLQWTATKKGTVSFKVVSATAGVEYDVALSSTGSSYYPTLSENPNGIVSIDVNPGDVVSIVVGTSPDANWNFPACDLTLMGSFQNYVPPTEPTEPPTEPTVPPTEPTVPPTEPTVPPTEPTVPPTEPTVPPTEPTVPPTEPTEPPVTKIDYKVSIVDKNGNLYKNDVIVRIFNENGQRVYQGNTTTGIVTISLEKGTYTVTLMLNDSSLSYDTNAAVLTPSAPNLTITLASKMEIVIENILDIDHFVLQEGTTNVKLGNSEANYAQMNGGEYNFFAFKITEPGVYTFTTSNTNAKISNWGSSDFFMSDVTSDEERAANKITLKLREENFPGDGSPITAKFAVKVNSAVTSTNIIIKYEGEVVLSPEEAAKWETYVPKVKQEKFKLAQGEGEKLVYMDVSSRTDKYKLVFNEDDGYYHLDKKNGPVIYVNLGGKAPYLSLQTMVSTAPVRAIIYDDNDVFVAKEDYTECLVGLTTSNPNKPNNDGYLECIDPTYGVYPLTKDLKHILESTCEYLGWAKKYGILYDQITNINPEIAWMFACCYVPEEI